MVLNQGLMKAGKRALKIVEADENLETEDILEMVNTGYTIIAVYLGNIFISI
jgi:hypothetical protein